MIFKSLHNIVFFLLFLGLAITLALPYISTVQAQVPVDIISTAELEKAGKDTLPITEDDATHPILRTTPDRSLIIKLDKNISSVIVGNPTHLNVLAEATDTLVLVAKTPGATHFTALDFKGNIVMQRHVLVAAPKDGYIRIRNSCSASDSDACEDTEMYYCPETCHKTALQEEKAESSDALDEANGQAGQAQTEEMIPTE